MYRAVVTTMLTDTTGNPLATDHFWQFRVAEAVFWTRTADGFWEDAANWSTGAVPGPEDTMVVESIPSDITVTHRNSTRAIKGLIAGERIVLDRGVWQIVEHIELTAPLSIVGGTLRGGIVRQSGSGRLVFAPKAVNTLDGIRLDGDLSTSRVCST